jgi:hypothetical protein
MDASPLFDPTYLPIILGTLVGFSVLAALLLVPISRFLDREQEVSEKWTPEELAKRLNEESASTNGAPSSEEKTPAE